jgi:circadian clock protein KaiB
MEREEETNNRNLGHFKLHLFVTGSSPRTARAIANLSKICEENLDGRFDLEVVDIWKHPEMAKSFEVFATSTLIKSLPEPLRRIIGELSDKEKVLAGLGLTKLKPHK